MAAVALSREIFDEVVDLSPEQQQQVLGFVRSLKVPVGTAGRSLHRFAGAIDPGELKQISDAIEEGCERISADEW
jgi:hypothetical protein